MSFTHYYLESMASYKQVEIEKQAREAWKFPNETEEKQANSVLEPVKIKEKAVLVASPSCTCEC
jgi:hypothetical protein